jgi:hypothetical protein
MRLAFQAANPGRRFCGDNVMLRLPKVARQRLKDRFVRGVSEGQGKREVRTVFAGLSRHRDRR